MAVRASQASVGIVAAILIDASGDDARMDFKALVHNKGAVPIFLGNSDVTTGNGYEVDAGEAVGLELAAGDSVYAISGTAGQRVDVLRTGVA